MPSFHASWRRTSWRLYPTAATCTSWPLLQGCPWRSFHGFCWMEPRNVPLSWVSPDHILELILWQLPIRISVISPKNCVHLTHSQMGGRLQHLHFAYKPVPIRVHHPEQKLYSICQFYDFIQDSSIYINKKKNVKFLNALSAFFSKSSSSLFPNKSFSEINLKRLSYFDPWDILAILNLKSLPILPSLF